MLKLFRSLFADQMRMMLPAAAIAGCFALGALLFDQFGEFLYVDQFGGFLFQFITMGCLFGLLLSSGILIFLGFLSAWMKFRNVFFTRQAYLYRTLPFSRLKLVACCFLSAFASLAATVIYLLLIVSAILTVFTAFNDLIGVIGELPGMFFWFACVLIMQGTMILVVGYTAQVIGSMMKSSPLAWSILSGIILYLLISLLVGGGMLLCIYVTYGSIDQIGLPSARIMSTMLMTGALLYAIVNLAMAFFDAWKLKKGVDVSE